MSFSKRSDSLGAHARKWAKLTSTPGHVHMEYCRWVYVPSNLQATLSGPTRYSLGTANWYLVTLGMYNM